MRRGLIMTTAHTVKEARRIQRSWTQRIAVAFLISGMVVTPTMVVAAPASNSFVDNRDQGVHYFKKRRYKLAYHLLRRAYSSKKAQRLRGCLYLAQAAISFALGTRFRPR